MLACTGRLYTDADIKDNSIQSHYGIRDTGSTPSGAEKRIERLLSGDTDYSGGGFDEGSAAEESIFDLNRNGKLNTEDRVDGNLDGDLDDRKDIPMGWERNKGAMSQATIAGLGQASTRFT
jgi:hypothetical protein